MVDIKNKTALVTGSSRGIGQQIVQGLANLGCNIIVHGRTKESCAATLSLLEKYPVKTYCVYGELSEEAGVKSIIQQVQNLNIAVDILYNNAAVMTPYKDDYLTHTWEEWILSMKVNVFAMYTLCAAFIPGMQARGFGRIVNLSSGIVDKPELAPYGASKWAVNKLTEDLAFKQKGNGLCINYLDPCWLQTDMGGPDADYPVQAVLPGALAPVLVEDDGPNGVLFRAVE
jgi:3-oxoacyl-[acyl-carrier protein] reductase